MTDDGKNINSSDHDRVLRTVPATFVPEDK